MKILLMNQHTLNHGDEAAGKALINKLLERKKNLKIIQIFYNSAHVKNSDYFSFDSKIIEHCKIKTISSFEKLLIFFSFFISPDIIERLCRLSSALNEELHMINDADVVISAPGGVNIGPYKRWRYLWRLYMALKLNKKLAIYSISFGPLPGDKTFQRVSKYVLRNANFLSLRDAKSQRFADDLCITYTPSIDTAFLETPNSELPQGLEHLRDESYVVVVPNELTKWHPCFKDSDPQRLISIYLNVIDSFMQSNVNVVLLPQLFGFENDSNYFAKLKNNSKYPSLITLIDSCHSSDIQQRIIRGSEFVVGARYHSIIFAINNKIPFFSLSYEHKMTNTLELLGLEGNCEELSKIIDDSKVEMQAISAIVHNFRFRGDIKSRVANAQKKAMAIANETFELFASEVN